MTATMTRPTVNLAIDFGTGLDNYLSDPHEYAMEMKVFVESRGSTCPDYTEDTAFAFMDAYETAVRDQLCEITERVMQDAHPELEITVDWVDYLRGYVSDIGDDISPELEADLNVELDQTYERVANHTYGNIG